jgi:hypothetical protein
MASSVSSRWHHVIPITWTSICQLEISPDEDGGCRLKSGVDDKMILLSIQEQIFGRSVMKS